MADTTPGQALNELRRIIKVNEDFKQAEAILSVLANADAVATAIKKDTTEAQKELDKVTSDLVSKKAELDSVTKSHSDIKQKASNLEEQGKKDYDSLLARGRTLADVMVEEATAAVKKLKDEAVEAKKQLESVKDELVRAVDKHESFKSEVVAQKQKLLDALK